jgi:DNA polymerase-3 subunit gamma/tau
LQALARKYRPRNFASVAVQSHVSTTLKGAIARGRVAHGYLLCGPRGVGKTTLARVLAMALNCENKREDGEPCGTCPSCVRIWSGSASLDVVEIDAASNRGVDDARDLRERAMYAPSGDTRYKVYIVDEAHMLTREAWNALLKILEEPPPRVVFVFATTEPQKIAQSAAPVLSRLQRFDFRRMSPADIRERLQAVLAAERIEASDDALGMIARAADGSMRDGLSLADQVLALGDGPVTAERVREALGLVAEDEYIALLDLITERRAGDVFPTVGRLVEQGIDLGQFLNGLSDMLRAQLAISLGATAVEVSERAREALVERKGRSTSGDLLRMLNAVAELEPKFRKSTQQQVLLEALLVRFALLDRTVELEAVLREMGGGAAPGGPGPRATPAPPPRPAPAGGGRGAQRADSAAGSDTPVRVQRVAEPKPSVGDSAPAASRTTPAGMAAVAEVAGIADRRPAVETKRGPRPVSTLDLNSIVERWDDILAGMRRDRPLVGALLEHAIPSAVTSGGVLTLQLDEAGAYENLSARLADLTAALAPQIAGLTRLALKAANGAVKPAPERMTAESVKSDTLQSLRKRSPLIAAAIDELDLELL